jgi:hypothetical protein
LHTRALTACHRSPSPDPHTKQSKFKPLKFSCKHRALLLTDLLQCMAAAGAMGRCLVAARVLG